jgi:hypothetical protein
VLPHVVVGRGWVGVALSLLFVMAASLTIALVLERWRLTKAVFLGSWPRGHSGPCRPLTMSVDSARE